MNMQENDTNQMGTKKPNVTIDSIIENEEGNSINKLGIKYLFNKIFFKKLFISLIKIMIISILSIIFLSLIYAFLIKGASFDIFAIDNRINSNLDNINHIEQKLTASEKNLSKLESLENKINEFDNKINIFAEDYGNNIIQKNLKKFNSIDEIINNISLKIVSLENMIKSSEELLIVKTHSKILTNTDSNEVEQKIIPSNTLLDKETYSQDLELLKKEIYQLAEDLNTRNIFSAELLYKYILSNVSSNKFFINEAIELKKLFPDLSNIKKIEILSQSKIPTKDSLLKDLDKLQLLGMPKIEDNSDIMAKFLSKVSKEITIRRVDDNIENISLSEVKELIIDDDLYKAIGLIKELPSNKITKNWIIRANTRLGFVNEMKILKNYILKQKSKKFIFEEELYGKNN